MLEHVSLSREHPPWRGWFGHNLRTGLPCKDPACCWATLTPLRYHTSEARLCSWIFSAELSLLSVTDSIYIISPTLYILSLNSVVKAIVLTLFFAQVQGLVWGTGCCMTSWAEFQIFQCNAALQGVEQCCSSSAEDLALGVERNVWMTLFSVRVGFNIRKTNFLIWYPNQRYWSFLISVC